MTDAPAVAPVSVLSKLKAFVVDAEHDVARAALAAKHEAEVLALDGEKEYKHLEVEAVTDIEALFARVRAVFAAEPVPAVAEPAPAA